MFKELNTEGLFNPQIIQSPTSVTEKTNWGTQLDQMIFCARIGI